MQRYKSVLLNLFAEGRQNQPYDFVRELKTKKIFNFNTSKFVEDKYKVKTHLFYCGTNSVTQSVRGLIVKATEDPQWVLRTPHWVLGSPTMGAWEPHATLRTAVAKHWSRYTLVRTATRR